MYPIVVKDILIFIRDRRAMTLTFLLPILLISIFALAFGGIGTQSEDEVETIAVADSDSTSHSRQLLERMDSLDNVIIELKDERKIRSDIGRGELSEGLIIPKGYGDSMQLQAKPQLTFLYDEAQKVEASIKLSFINQGVIGPLNQTYNRLKMEEYLNGAFPENDTQTAAILLKNIDSLMSSDSKILHTESFIKPKHHTNLGLIQAVSGTAIMMLLFTVSGLSVELINEKEQGTLKRLMITPLNPLSIIIGKVLSTFIISILQLLIMIVFANLAFGLPIINHLPELTLMVVASAFAVTGFGLFLASVVSNQKQAQSLSTLIILLMSAIGGSMIPLFLMPDIMQNIAVFSINYWSIQGFYDILWRDLPFLIILNKALILFATGFLMSLLAVILFKRSIKS